MYATSHSSGNTSHLNDRLLFTDNSLVVVYFCYWRIPDGSSPVDFCSGKV